MRTIAALVMTATMAVALPSARQALDLSGHVIVDLSHAYGPSTVFWPTSPTKFALEKLAYGRTEGGFFYAANTLSTPEHGGTHLDAPIHFFERGRTAEQIPLEQLIAPAVVIDVSARAATDRDYRATAADVLEFEKAHGAARAESPDGGGDVIGALLGLGYNEREAQAAVKQLPADLQLADAIRQALRLLAKT